LLFGGVALRFARSSVVLGRGAKPRSVRQTVAMHASFAPLCEYPGGLIAGMLVESYAALLRELGERKAGELRSNWLEFDTAVQQDRDSVGACGFVTRAEGNVVGFGSWDPRGWPEVGRVGHNCIRPAYQGNGYGWRQIEEILRRF
jgi:hypothetical protein